MKFLFGAPQQALRYLDEAFKRCFKVPVTGQAKFKNKNVKDSFYLEGNIRISGNKIKIPKFGGVKCYEILPTVKLKNVTISKRADDWYISFKYELEPICLWRVGVIHELPLLNSSTIKDSMKQEENIEFTWFGPKGLAHGETFVV
ncbi:hypothetical protein [Floridanema aerugineum]|uniref:LAGLIDADG homing endonuclease n=1 Tax=Floridaenema aerugineum BLCC-F46 TaxID=3153654 RepID=A0ABV4XJ46_9CYAN